MAPPPALELPDPVAEQARWLADDVALVETRERFPSANSLVATDGHETVLVDAGLGEAALEALAPLVDEVVLTHFHLDHTLYFPAVEGVPVRVPEAERAVFEGQPFPSFVGASPAAAERFEASFGDVYPSFALDPVTFTAGDVLELAGTRWEVVAAPGHSPGHCLLHEPERSILFTTDVEFSGMGPWYAWPHCDPTAFQEAIEAARPRFTQARTVASSHSPPIVDDPEAVREALDAFLAVFDERDEAVQAVLAERGEAGARVAELVDEVRIFYGDHVEKDPSIRYWTRVMTEKHLERLEAAGRAEPVDGTGDRWRATASR